MKAQSLLTPLFWFSAGMVAYTFAGYPALALCLARLFSRRGGSAENGREPGVSVVVVAHNEASRIESRIRNLLEGAPAGEAFEIVIVSDGSTDETVGVARAAG